ncbi:MAG: hypothetical protein ACI85O_001448 [Saprospiraceae bacterium]|jgi:hypothetical protein
MKRRTFLKKAGITSAASIGVPYILPTGRLFAQTNVAMAEHVVLVMFAGGVRHQESILQRYLADSQGLDIEGNIMYNMLQGMPPDLKIVYGTDTPDGQPGGQPISPILQTPLQLQGTLFGESRFSSSGTGHFTGLSTGMSGHYGVTQGLRQRPVHPTIFEYVRRYMGAKATDTWFIGNGIRNSVPLLNYSAHPDFGSQYGGNFFAPNITFGEQGEEYLKGFRIYHPEEELTPIQEMRTFLNQNFMQSGAGIPNLNNTEEEKEDIKNFIKTTFERKENGLIAFPTVNDNGDLNTVSYAAEVLRYFKPKVTVINMNAVDSCHSSYTDYLKALHRGDHAVGFLWNYIQTQIPDMADKTAIIIQPEHGRNYNPNGIIDQNDWNAFDHDGDANSRRIFTMMAGPGIDPNLQIGTEEAPIGDASDIVPTIAEILGIKNDVMSRGLLHGGAMSLFDRI